MRWVGTALREPLFQFMLAGAALFMAASLYAEANSPQRIVIDQARVALLQQRYTLQFGEPPSRERLQRLIDEFVREEALYRQGLALGLDQGDEVVRRRVAQKMDFLSDSEAFTTAPTRTEVQDYYTKHAGRYREPGRVTFSMLYFSPDKGGEARARARAGKVLADLAAGRPAQDGDAFQNGGRFDSLSVAESQIIFGASDLTRALSAAPEGAWFGPVRSGLGWHLVRIETRTEPQQISLEAAEPRVRQDLQLERQDEAKRAAQQDILKNYRIVHAYRLDELAAK